MNTDRNVGSFAASAESRQSDFVIAIDFGGTKIDVATANCVGELLERALTLARSLMARTAALTGGRCLAAGVVSPGVILPDRILLAPNVPGWEQLALTDIVRDRLEMSRIAVGTDVKAAAVAEARWGSLQDADPGIFLSLGTGIALAIVIGGKVLMGAHGTAGEIGYSLRSVADEKGGCRRPCATRRGGRWSCNRRTGQQASGRQAECRRGLRFCGCSCACVH